MSDCVTFASTSAPADVGGVTSSRALIWEARIGAVGGNVYSRLAFFRNISPARFLRTVLCDDTPSLAGLPLVADAITRNLALIMVQGRQTSDAVGA